MVRRKLGFLYPTKSLQLLLCHVCWYFVHIRNRLSLWLNLWLVKYFKVSDLCGKLPLHSSIWKLGRFAWIFLESPWQSEFYSSSYNSETNLLLHNIPSRSKAFIYPFTLDSRKFWPSYDETVFSWLKFTFQTPQC